MPELKSRVLYDDTYKQFLDDIRDYVEKIETEDSGIVCSCLWKYNPLDVINEVPPEKCRKLLDTENELCPVHTKKGFIHGFFEFVVGEYSEEWVQVSHGSTDESDEEDIDDVFGD